MRCINVESKLTVNLSRDGHDMVVKMRRNMGWKSSPGATEYGDQAVKDSMGFKICISKMELFWMIKRMDD